MKWGEKFSGLGGGAGGWQEVISFPSGDAVPGRVSFSVFSAMSLICAYIASNLQGVRNTPGERERDTPSPPCGTTPVPVVEGSSEFEGNARRFERQFLGPLGRW